MVVKTDVSVKTMHTVILWMVHAHAEKVTMALYVINSVPMVHTAFTARISANARMTLFVQLMMVSVLVRLVGMVSTVNCSVMRDTMVSNVRRSAFVFMKLHVTMSMDTVIALMAG